MKLCTSECVFLLRQNRAAVWVPGNSRIGPLCACPEIAENLDRACNPPSADVVVMSALFLALFHGLFHGLMEKSVAGAHWKWRRITLVLNLRQLEDSGTACSRAP